MYKHTWLCVLFTYVETHFFLCTVSLGLKAHWVWGDESLAEQCHKISFNSGLHRQQRGMMCPPAFPVCQPPWQAAVLLSTALEALHNCHPLSLCEVHWPVSTSRFREAGLTYLGRWAVSCFHTSFVPRHWAVSQGHIQEP